MVGGSNPSCPATIKVKIMEKFINYIKLSKLEIMKVIFPTKEQIRNAFIAVFIVVAVVSLFFALVVVIIYFFISKFL